MYIHYTRRDAARLLFWLIGCELALCAAYLLIHVAPGAPWKIVQELFDMNGEVSIPTWFSTVQLFGVASVLFFASAADRSRRGEYSTLLLAGSLLFLFLSADEGGGIHERVTGVVSNSELAWLTFPGGHGAWILIYTVAAIVLLLFAARYLRKDARRMWRRFRRESMIAFGGAALFVAGAVGFEIISYLFFRSGSTPVLLNLGTAVEELLEMSGTSMILYAALVGASELSIEPAARRESLPGG